MQKFDSHVHIFPDKLLGKVLPKLSLICNSPYYTDGSLSDALSKLENEGVNSCLFLNIATNVHQESSVNNFAFELKNKGYEAFGSVHPDSEAQKEMLYKIKEQGLKGIKLHPDYQGFNVDEDKMGEIYSLCEKLELIIAFHTGFDPLSPNHVHCSPESLSKVADSFPRLKIIAAHMGGMKKPDEVKKYLCGKKNVWFDTAYASFFLNEKEFYKLTMLHGVDKILFATDSPWSTPNKEIALIENSPLSVCELEEIYYNNAAKLLNLE